MTEVLSVLKESKVGFLTNMQNNIVKIFLQKLLPGVEIVFSTYKTTDKIVCSVRLDKKDAIVIISRNILEWQGTELVQGINGMYIYVVPVTYSNIRKLQELIPCLKPTFMGNTGSSFGLGDRTGYATAGHAQIIQKYNDKVFPVFAQQSIREMTRTQRTPEDVMKDTVFALFKTGWQMPWGADADHLKTIEDIDKTSGCGFVLFTLDPSEFVQDTTKKVLDAFEQEIVKQAVKNYEGKTYEFCCEENTKKITINSEEIEKAAIKYGKALKHCFSLVNYIRSKTSYYELEFSFDETSAPTTFIEHIYLAEEIRQKDIKISSLALRFVGEFEKAIDYKGDVQVFKENLLIHYLISQKLGPYKLSFHSGSDKFRIYPVIAEICKGNFHIKTAGTSFLEALRVVAQVNPNLFKEIICLARNVFLEAKKSYHISATLSAVLPPDELNFQELEHVYLNTDAGRQILHVSFGNIISKFKNELFSVLETNQELYGKFLGKHFKKHLDLVVSN